MCNCATNPSNRNAFEATYVAWRLTLEVTYNIGISKCITALLTRI